MRDAEQSFAEIAELFQARDSAGAERLLRQVLAAQPDHVGSLNLLALIAGRAGRDGECVELLTRAIACGTPEQAAGSGLLLGAAHARASRLDAAEATYRRVLAISPLSAEAALRLGLLLADQGRHDEAIDALRHAVAADPGLALAHGALASALHAAGDLAGAALSAEAALALAPEDRNFAANLAVLRNAEGRYAEAAAVCRSVLALGEEPGLLNTLGVALKEMGKLDVAAASFERAAALQPGFAAALYNLAMARKDQGRAADAARLLRTVLEIAPELAAARFALCMVQLRPLYRDEAEIDAARADYAAELAALASHAGRKGAAALAVGVGAAQPFYLAYQGRNDAGLQRRYGELVCRAMAAAFPATPLAAAPAPGERIRLGVVCGHIRRHAVWRLPTRGWVEGLDRSRFELIAYHTGALRDEETARAAGLFERFMQGPLPVAAWRDRIAADRPHALIYPEIGMDPMAAQLGAMRLAPVQYASWGHPSTSGYPTIDFFLSSAAMEPADGEAHYTERLVRLAGLSTTVTLERRPARVLSRAELGLPQDGVVFWCGQSLYKYLPRHDAVLAAIAARTPGARFVFIEFPDSPSLTERFRDRLAGAFAAVGVSAAETCVFLPRMAVDAFLGAMACADVVLDSLGWSGCNSLLDALALGLPIVTTPGATMRARHGAAILGQLGLEASVAPTEAAYVELAVRLATSAEARAQARDALERGLRRLNQTSAIEDLTAHILGACAAPGGAA